MHPFVVRSISSSSESWSLRSKLSRRCSPLIVPNLLHSPLVWNAGCIKTNPDGCSDDCFSLEFVELLTELLAFSWLDDDCGAEWAKLKMIFNLWRKIGSSINYLLRLVDHWCQDNASSKRPATIGVLPVFAILHDDSETKPESIHKRKDQCSLMFRI